MYKEFVLLDRNNNIEKKAHAIVKFNFDDKNYLVYSVEENEQNSQIFVSKLILNSEGKYFIDDISSEDKGKLSNIVYNIVILLPSDYEKGNDFQSLLNNLFSKFSVKLLSGLPNIDKQDYYSNCSIAITNKLLVDNAVKLYSDNLNKEIQEVVEVPTWTSPLEVTAPTPVDVHVNDVQENSVMIPAVTVQEPAHMPDLNLQSNPVLESTAEVFEDPVVNPEVVNSVPTSVSPVISAVEPDKNEDVLPNPQAEKLAIVSDPSLGIGVQQPNVMQNKKAGFANTKYVVVGSICLILAIAVIITAYILIKNMS